MPNAFGREECRFMLMAGENYTRTFAQGNSRSFYANTKEAIVLLERADTQALVQGRVLGSDPCRQHDLFHRRDRCGEAERVPDIRLEAAA